MGPPECRHNLLYWSQGDYRGFGCAAHSHEAARRWWNVRTPERYLALVAAGEATEAADEVLGPEDRRIEGLVHRQDGRATLTLTGRLLANEVAVRLR